MAIVNAGFQQVAEPEVLTVLGPFGLSSGAPARLQADLDLSGTGDLYLEFAIEGEPSVFWLFPTGFFISR